MNEAEYGLTNMAMNAGQGLRPGDETLLVRFYHAPVQNSSRTLEEGRPIFDEVEHIGIRVPGKKEEVIRVARQADKERFPEHYRRFKAREEQNAVEGTVLSEWPGVTRSQVEEFRYFNVFTVEQLASLNDNHGHNIMGINALKQKAKAYLEASKDNATASALIEAKKRNDELEEKLAALTARLDGLDAPKRRKRRTKAEMEAAQE